jgi:hypothetical protein
VSFGTK